MSRKETPDILGALMGEPLKQESNKEIQKQNNKTINKKNHKAANKVSNKVTPRQLMFDGTVEGQETTPEEEIFLKEKATFNLSQKLLVELEDKCYEMRKLSDSKRITKTLIVEEALKMAFSEFDLKKHISKFYCNMVSNK